MGDDEEFNDDGEAYDVEVNNDDQLIIQLHNKDLKYTWSFWIACCIFIELVFAITYVYSILRGGNILQPGVILFFILPSIGVVLYIYGAYIPYPRTLIVNKVKRTMRVVYDYMLRGAEKIDGWSLNDITDIEHDIFRNIVVAILAGGQRKMVFRCDFGTEFVYGTEDSPYRRYVKEVDMLIDRLRTALKSESITDA